MRSAVFRGAVHSREQGPPFEQTSLVQWHGWRAGLQFVGVLGLGSWALNG